MIIIGIHGAIGHGKTTFAEQLSEIEPNSAHYESSAVISEVLDELHWTLHEPFENNTAAFVSEWLTKLPPILKEVVHVDTTVEELAFSDEEVREHPLRFQKLFEHAANLQRSPDLARQIVTPENKSQYRAGLQGIGGYLVGKVSPTIWYDELVRRITTDGEGKELSIAGGVRFPSEAEVIRNAGGIIIEIVRPDVPEKDIQDPTEKFRKQIRSDSKIINNGTIEDLQITAKRCLADIAEDSLRPTYISNVH